MSIPAAPGHVWKRTAEGMQHQVRFDDSRYDEEGRLTARCGEPVTPIVEQPACPGCLTASPAADLADVLEARTVEAFGDALTTTTGEAFSRDR